MTNIQTVDHDSWLVRYSSSAPGFSRSNQRNDIQGLEEQYWERGGRLKVLLKGEIKEGWII